MPVTTPYRFEYEACSLVFMLVVTVRFFLVKRFPSKTNRLFGIILFFAIADLALDVFGSFTIMNAATFPIWANYIINSVFYILQLVFPVLLMLYVILSAGKTMFYSPRIIALYLPCVISVMAVMFTYWTRWVFYLDDLNGATAYFHGPYFALLYSETFFYLIVTLRLIWQFRNKLDKRQRSTMIEFIMIIAASVVVQAFFTNVLLTGVAMSLAILMMYFIIQNPDDMLDSISGVFNYNAMIVYLDSAIKNMSKLRFITVDVGEIRRINSQFGLLTGNQLLGQVGAFLNKLDKNIWVFRMVGTRFLLATTHRQDLSVKADEIKGFFSKAFVDRDNQIKLTVTIRYSNEDNEYRSSEEIIELIDEVYAGIGVGNWGQCKAIHQDALEHNRRKNLIERTLQTALTTNTMLSLHYQPLYGTRESSFTTAEALLRLQSPLLGAISPAEFIPLAEVSGMILKIDDYVVKSACDFLSRNGELECLHVNLSAAEFFSDPSERIHDIVLKSGVSPSRLCFEVTETAADHYPEHLERFMRTMIARGYRFALDDFGMGYSNIARVVTLPFDLAKIDKSLINDNPRTLSLFRSITRMFNDIGVKTVVEGVETLEQSQRVLDKVDYIQGFLYAKPMPEDEFLAFISRQKMPLCNGVWVTA